MALVDLKLVLVLLMAVALVRSADNATTAAPKPTASASAPTTASTPTKPPGGILEAAESFFAAIPIGIATACETGAEAVKKFFTNPWW